VLDDRHAASSNTTTSDIANHTARTGTLGNRIILNVLAGSKDPALSPHPFGSDKGGAKQSTSGVRDAPESVRDRGSRRVVGTSDADELAYYTDEHHEGLRQFPHDRAAGAVAVPRLPSAIGSPGDRGSGGPIDGRLAHRDIGRAASLQPRVHAKSHRRAAFSALQNGPSAQFGSQHCGRFEP